MNSFADYKATQDARNTIQLNVRKYTLMLCDVLLDNFKSKNNNKTDGYKFYIESGRKYQQNHYGDWCRFPQCSCLR